MEIPLERIEKLPESFINHYRKFISDIPFESQEEKNDVFMLMKEFLYQLPKL